MADNIAAKVSALIGGVVAELGFDLWDVRFLKEGASYYLRVYIDKPEGVDINDCADVSHAIDPMLDEADPISESYYLEVCSPGVERELRLPEHFAKMAGREVTVRLYRAENGEKEISGRLLSFDGGVVIETAEGERRFEKGEYSTVKLNDMF